MIIWDNGEMALHAASTFSIKDGKKHFLEIEIDSLKVGEGVNCSEASAIYLHLSKEEALEIAHTIIEHFEEK